MSVCQYDTATEAGVESHPETGRHRILMASVRNDVRMFAAGVQDISRSGASQDTVETVTLCSCRDCY